MRPLSESIDALVIGAGPAGAMTALLLARRGVAVTLVDKSTWPRDKVCGSCLNGAALRVLHNCGLGELTSGHGARPLRTLRLASGRRRATVELPGSVALSRRTLDAALVHAALHAGATFHPQTSAHVVSVDPPMATLRGPSDEMIVRPRAVVVADGLGGRATGAPSTPAPGSRMGAGVIVDRAPAAYGDGAIHMAVARGGYVGLVRLEDGSLDIAAAFDPSFVRASGSPGEAAARVLDASGWPPIDGLPDAPWRGTPLLTRRRADVATAGAFVVGDAAGYVEPFSGEGIAWALESAAALAPIVATACRAEVGVDESHRAAWREAHGVLLRRRHTRCRLLARLLRSRTLTQVALAAVSIAPSVGRAMGRAFSGGVALDSAVGQR